MPFRLLSAFIASLSAGLFGAEAAPKNIVFILADDLGRECLECYGGESYPTPNLNRLAAEGTRFEACYATPMCSPTRVMAMTGRYNFRNYTEWGKMDLDQPTLGTVLKDAGYTTGIFGKWHLGGWNHPPYGPTRAGFDRYATFDYEKVVREGGKLGNQFWKTEVWEDGRNFRLDGYGPAHYKKQALQFILSASTQGERKPFFLYYPLVHAHRPFVPTDHVEATDPERIVKKGELRHFQGMVAYIDGIVGDVLKTLEESGQLEKTVVVFSADNGTDNVSEARELRSRYRGAEMPGGKYLPIELGANVPLLIRGPGVSAGRVLNSPVDFTDLMPTFCAIAGTDPPSEIDGENLWPMLRGGPESSHDGLALTWGVFEKSSKKYKDPRAYQDELIHFIRDERWKLYSTGELFDLKNDWQEVSPLLDDAQPKVRERLGTALNQRRNSEPRLW